MPRKGRVEAAFDVALRSVTRTAADGAAVALARTYARAIDAGIEELSKVGPKMLDVLTELGMTPKARADLAKNITQAPAPSPGLDELRARRETRAR